MNTTKLITIFSFIFPVTALAVVNPPSLKEICSVGQSCSYTISGRTNRIIHMPNLLPLTLYTCSVILGDGLNKIKITNVRATPDVHYNVKSPDLGQSPFLSFININSEKQGSITYSLYNSDFYGLSHNVAYRCTSG